MLRRLAVRLIRAFKQVVQQRTNEAEELGRLNTVSRVIGYFSSVVIIAVALMLILGELGISVAPILATAGVAGVAIGFGAQSLVKDYLSGFFILLEDQIRVGDVVEVAGKGGLVEELTLRYVRLRDMDGHVHYIPNGEIKAVTNRTRGYATPVIDVSVAYREDTDEVVATLRQVAAALRADPKWTARIVDDLEVIGVDQLGESGVVVRARLKVVPPIEQWNVKREYLRRLKKAFDERGIEIPFPHLTVYPGEAKDGSAPPFRVEQSK